MPALERFHIQHFIHVGDFVGVDAALALPVPSFNSVQFLQNNKLEWAFDKLVLPSLLVIIFEQAAVAVPLQELGSGV